MKAPAHPVRQFIVVIALFLGLSSVINAVDIDPTFHPQIQTSTYAPKAVEHLVALPDGKFLAAGFFNTYNGHPVGATVGGQPIGALIRLNADGTLDTTFNNDVHVWYQLNSILVQPDGKILLIDHYSSISRLTRDGYVDTSFNPAFTSLTFPERIGAKLDSSGRLLVQGTLLVTENGVQVTKYFLRLNDDGTIDPTFNAPSYGYDFVNRFCMQGDKIVYFGGPDGKLYRLNEDGSADKSFVPTAVGYVTEMITQSDGKINVFNGEIIRVNEDGGIDAGFRLLFENAQMFRLQHDGKIIVAGWNHSASLMRMSRFLVDGSADPSFSTYDYYPGDFYLATALAVTDDGGVLIGDQAGMAPVNRFTKLLSSGQVDTSFNAGRTGFQTIDPCKISTISALPNGKVLFAGAFDIVNGVPRPRIAMLNDDSTLDPSFQINTNPTGNYFSLIRVIYNTALQSDGKILVSGNFEYFINGDRKTNVVRLNADGSIDPSFGLSVIINDNGFVNLGRVGTNKPLQRADGKILVATSRGGSGDMTTTPLLLNANGSKDESFSSVRLFSNDALSIFDIAVQTDGKILIAGFSSEGGAQDLGLIARLNSDGTIDPTFQPYHSANLPRINAVSVLPNGKILFAGRSENNSIVSRLNADGSIDSSFNSGAVVGKVNAIVGLPDGKILAGGLFTSFNGQARRNLAVLNANGTLADETVNINNEVVCLTIDNQGRVLIGGSFTAIGGGGQQNGSPYIARLISSNAQPSNVPFDYDGDGKTDISVFRPAAAQWYLLRSTEGFYGAQFGIPTDKIAPADYDGDGRTDIAVYRPSTGIWYVFETESGTVSYHNFGLADDLPLPADHDGDGRAEISVFRPSTATWYRQNSSSGSFGATQFGASDDKPTVGDFDGDGLADIAVFRPATGAWYRINSFDGSIYGELFGIETDVLAPADYDGDGKTDLAVYRPSTGTWYIKNSSNATYDYRVFGLVDDIPAQGDFDGDGRADISVFRPSDGNWYRQNSADGSFAAFQFGTNGDKPTMTAFRY